MKNNYSHIIKTLYSLGFEEEANHTLFEHKGEMYNRMENMVLYYYGVDGFTKKHVFVIKEINSFNIVLRGCFEDLNSYLISYFREKKISKLLNT